MISLLVCGTPEPITWSAVSFQKTLSNKECDLQEYIQGNYAQGIPTKLAAVRKKKIDAPYCQESAAFAVVANRK